MNPLPSVGMCNFQGASGDDGSVPPEETDACSSHQKKHCKNTAGCAWDTARGICAIELIGCAQHQKKHCKGASECEWDKQLEVCVEAPSDDPGRCPPL